MKNLFFLLFFSCLFGCQTEQDHSAIKGIWLGTAEVEPYPEFVKFSYDTFPKIQLFYQQHEQKTVVDFDHEKGEIAFPLDENDKLGLFEGEVENGVMKGNFILDEKQDYACNLMKVVPMGLQDVGQLVGFYQIGSEHMIEVLPYPLALDITGLAISDYKTGKYRIAFPTSPNKFVAGKRMLTPYPTDLSFTMIGKNSNGVPGIEFEDEGEVFKATRMPDLEDYEDFDVQNDTIELACTISFPRGDENQKFPLVINVAGAGDKVRANQYTNHLTLLPRNGIAVLTFDKRGCGNSTGNVYESSYHDFASDVLAIIEAVKKNPKIDASRIGLTGFDQAGFVMPIVASKSKDVKFMVSLAGSAMSAEAQEYIACQQRMESDGFDAVEVNEALAYQKNMFKYLRGEIDSNTFKQISEQTKNEPWAEGGYVTFFDNKKYINQWKFRYDFDPVPFLDKSDMPMLIVYGENDLIAPPKYNFPIIKKVYEKNAHPQNQLILYENANHLFMLGENRGDLQITEIRGYAPGLFNKINNWILKQFEMERQI